MKPGGLQASRVVAVAEQRPEEAAAEAAKASATTGLGSPAPAKMAPGHCLMSLCG
jgi:hypothetical protein